MESELFAFQTSSAPTLAPDWRTELTEAAVNSQLTQRLAKRYVSRATEVAAFLGPIAARYRTQARKAKRGHARRWFKQHAEHVEAWLVHLTAMESAES